MNIEDVKIGMKVKLISTVNTEDHLGYDEDMLSVGETGIVAGIITDDDFPDYVKVLEDGNFYDIRDLEAVEDAKEKSIGNLTVNISTEDKQEIAKDILKIILGDLNSVITNAIQSLSEVDRGEVSKDVGGSVLTVGKLDEDVLSNLLLLIDDAAENRDHQSVDVLTKAYQRIKSVQTI